MWMSQVEGSQGRRTHPPTERALKPGHRAGLVRALVAVLAAEAGGVCPDWLRGGHPTGSVESQWSIMGRKLAKGYSRVWVAVHALGGRILPGCRAAALCVAGRRCFLRGVACFGGSPAGCL